MSSMYRFGMVFVLCAMVAPAIAVGAEPPTGLWRGWLDCPGGEIPFHFELKREGDKWSGWLINEPDRAEIPKVTWDGTDLVLDISHYDSILRAKSNATGDQWDGTWRKRSKADKWIELPFHARPSPRTETRAATTLRFPSEIIEDARNIIGDRMKWEDQIFGRWSVRFGQEAENSILLLTMGDYVVATFYGRHSVPRNLPLHGTILATTGDYGFLAGDFDGRELRLSNFDGAHAFLFKATLRDEVKLSGDFWSRDAFHDTWTALKDPDARLPDAFEMTKGVDNADLAKVAFPDLTGKVRSLADPGFSGKARVVEVFGSWCPNCHDASHYLADLHRRYRDKGLVVIGLAFELTGDLSRDTEQVKKFVERHKAEYPVLVAGVSDREKASAALPMLDKLRAYPTLIVLDKAGKVRATYTGFSGPATGDAYAAFQHKFESLIEDLLATP